MKAVKTIFNISLKARFGSLNLDLGYKGSKRVLGVFGVSGSGKTTFLECLAGLRKVMSGQITVAGEIWLDTETSCFVPTEKRHMGYVPQDHLLFPHNLLLVLWGQKDVAGKTLSSLRASSLLPNLVSLYMSQEGS